MNNENEKEISFEEAMQKLEEIVGKLEEGDVPLEKAIAYYQEGMALSKKCSDQLTQVEEKVTQIMNQYGESEPFDLQGEA
ncbi:exodeoxyribonuclease VII small subunit [Lentibacillus saliphilus]|uniref:exodeoxyribonuclease VII small subunit n=1 Tax=Lentibacillus saliphilus TaxID=2737028 RepID=UPI001C309377|nr:exodeoxyribonuclease VII small subunit [Lentibacillus saliphilus]